MNLKIKVVALGVVGLFALSGCANITELVDSKNELSVPGSTVPCYFVEIETMEGDKEIGEENKCVTKAVYDKQKVGQPFVP